MDITCISDLHGFYPELEGGDLLIVAGDLTARDRFTEYQNFFKWLLEQKYSRKILVAGNHDNHLKGLFYNGEETDLAYLCDSGTEFEGLNIWGSPWTKTFEGMNPHCKAFTLDTEEELEEKWRMIPWNVDILITHSPPYGILDEVAMDVFIEGHQCYHFENVGSHSLGYYSRMHQPKLHVFGHIHEGYGKEVDEGTTIYVNASYVNEYYQPVNKPIRIEL